MNVSIINILRFSLTALLIQTGSSIAYAQSEDNEKVILDEDWNIDSGGFVAEPFLIPYLSNNNINILGLTSVTGDNWKKEGEQSLLRFLELVNSERVSVYSGATYPLNKTYTADQNWQKKYGQRDWNGAWNVQKTQSNVHPNSPEKVIPPVWGLPHKTISEKNAVDFIIDSTNNNPEQVSLLTDAPLTNYAIAVKKDISLSNRTKQLVIMSSNVTEKSSGYLKSAPFNIYFDPEAAQDVLSARWRKLVFLIPNKDIVLDKKLLFRIYNANHFIGNYFSKSHAEGLPLWPIIGPAYLISKESVIKRFNKRVKVNIDPSSPQYGNLFVFPDNNGESDEGTEVEVVMIDTEKALDIWLNSLTSIK